MSTSKKSTSKSAKSPAPATKSVASKAPAATKTVRSAIVRTPAQTPVAMLAPSPAPVATPAVKKVVAAKAVVTTITARVDVGFGNTLFIRGEGAGLSWEKGRAMQCIGADLWQVVLDESARAYTFKFLVNDVTWSTGPDYSAACGTSITLTPEF
jgi:hypothetical protein